MADWHKTTQKQSSNIINRIALPSTASTAPTASQRHEPKSVSFAKKITSSAAKEISKVDEMYVLTKKIMMSRSPERKLTKRQPS